MIICSLLSVISELLYFMCEYVNYLQHTDPSASHTKFWILYRESTAGFGSSSINNDKNVLVVKAVGSLFQSMCGILNLELDPGFLIN